MIPESGDAPVPPVDLNKPVENPALVSAIDSFTHEPGPAQLRILKAELNKAVFLLANLMDEADEPKRIEAGMAFYEKGSRFAVLGCWGPSDERALALFTDWTAIAAFTDKRVQGLVVTADTAWQWALERYDIAVINPGSRALPLGREQLQELARWSNAPWKDVLDEQGEGVNVLKAEVCVKQPIARNVPPALVGAIRRFCEANRAIQACFLLDTLRRLSSGGEEYALFVELWLDDPQTQFEPILKGMQQVFEAFPELAPNVLMSYKTGDPPVENAVFRRPGPHDIGSRSGVAARGVMAAVLGPIIGLGRWVSGGASRLFGRAPQGTFRSVTGGPGFWNLFPKRKRLKGVVKNHQYMAPDGSFSVALPHPEDSYEYAWMRIEEGADIGEEVGELYVMFGPAAFDRNIYQASVIFPKISVAVERVRSGVRPSIVPQDEKQSNQRSFWPLSESSLVECDKQIIEQTGATYELVHKRMAKIHGRDAVYAAFERKHYAGDTLHEPQPTLRQLMSPSANYKGTFQRGNVTIVFPQPATHVMTCHIDFGAGRIANLLGAYHGEMGWESPGEAPPSFPEGEWDQFETFVTSLRLLK